MRRSPREQERSSRFVGPERRRIPRYYVTVPVEFDGRTGTTKDVNESGVRFEIDHPLAPEQPVTFRLVFRDFQGGDPWRMAVRGKVLRVETSGTAYTVAVRVTSYVLAEAPSAD
jgi:PilZ domain